MTRYEKFCKFNIHGIIKKEFRFYISTRLKEGVYLMHHIRINRNVFPILFFFETLFY